MKEMSSRRKTGLGLALLLLLVIAAGLTVGIGTAYFSDQESVKNSIWPGDSNIEITEEFDPPDRVVPGDIIAKSVRITNKGKSDCFVRCRLILDDEEIWPYLTLDTDMEQWVKEKDGYFYYKTSLEKGEITSQLLRFVKIAEDTPKELTKKGFSLTVYAESYQKGEFNENEWEKAWEHFSRNKKETGGENQI